ncbi:MAG: hypothetical protein ACLTG4_08140 [Oscillospiraceae bacterium]
MVGTAPDGRAVLTQRNKFAVDTLELITSTDAPVTFTAADGTARRWRSPYLMQRFTMPLPCKAAPVACAAEITRRNG